MEKYKITTAGPEGMLTFNVRSYANGEWVAQCEEVSGILTGGNEKDDKFEQIFDAIIAAYGYTYPQKNP